jgi:hypothetical protein
MRGASALARGFVCGFWFLALGSQPRLDFTFQDVDDDYMK